jgi:2-phospho-L-lactate guanylyltransferase
MASGSVVLVPVKSFELAKGRLADVLDRATRSTLARNLASGVVAAARPLPTYIVCDNAEVASWAVSIGANVMWIPARGLNEAVAAATTRAAVDGYRRAVISHGDLPLASNLTWLGREATVDEMVIVPDRHGDGTNVMAVPLPLPDSFRFRYGVGSAAGHAAEAARWGLRARTVIDEQLGWDLDTPDDLQAWQQRQARQAG